MKKKQIEIFAVFILLAIFAASSVFAVGVAIPYWDSPEWYPLKLAPGESKIVVLTLQNTGEEDITFKATLTSGSEIAALADEDLEYFVPSGEINKQVNIMVEIPESTELQSRYKVTVSFQPISPGGEGTVSLATGLVASFPVEAVGYEESVKRTETPPIPEESKNYTWTIILVILILIVIAAILVKKSRKAKTQKKEKNRSIK